jgi:hypothetical protein
MFVAPEESGLLLIMPRVLGDDEFIEYFTTLRRKVLSPGLRGSGVKVGSPPGRPFANIQTVHNDQSGTIRDWKWLTAHVPRTDQEKYEDWFETRSKYCPGPLYERLAEVPNS